MPEKFYKEKPRFWEYLLSRRNGRKGFSPDSIKTIRKIGEGVYGHISEVEIEKVSGQRLHKKRMAIKEFIRPERISDAARAQKMFRHLKSLGIKTFPTQRISSTRDKIIMTLGHNRDKVLIGSTNNSPYGLIGMSFEKINRISNFQKFLESIVKNAEIASRANTYLPDDSYFFEVDRTESPDKSQAIDFVIGDLDNVRIYPRQVDFSELQSQNLANASLALKFFITYNVEGRENYLKYIREADSFFSRALQEANGRVIGHSELL